MYQRSPELREHPSRAQEVRERTEIPAPDLPAWSEPAPARHSETGGLIVGVLLALLLVLAVWYFGFEAQGAGSGIDVDVPAAPATELQPSG